jgi:hypothetical protein
LIFVSDLLDVYDRPPVRLRYTCTLSCQVDRVSLKS